MTRDSMGFKLSRVLRLRLKTDGRSASLNSFWDGSVFFWRRAV